ncbi:hypothetical protein HBI81_085520 [Parastagonospora nodorum]|nr:hypothetical protein HBI12_168450 [Parastagonospora nodorum]KAH5423528.1 hypothetical protein HBI47_126280 [Parastagonospora nodorum]KAH5472610.1 hypothetical protein HBI28_133960 [Parastagonospora nodorum]KAH5512227.1 hypothetical protein HBI29_106430 [Parastagonospora nodorum]KAH5601699.1 hypothetical protein HBI45_132050 [Parastagonospora nodorum]
MDPEEHRKLSTELKSSATLCASAIMLSLWSRTGLNHSRFWIEADPSTQGYMKPLVYLDVGLALHYFRRISNGVRQLS